MAGGAISQLSMTGEQDIVLYSKPEITFWRLMSKRSTQFSMEQIPQSFQSDSGFGRKSILPITKSGDLVWTVYLQVTLPALQDFAIDAIPVAAAAAVPGILSARWTSSTTAEVKIIPTTDGSSASYDVLHNDGTSDVTVNGAAGETTITLTGLDNAESYTVKARRLDGSGSAGSWSSTTPLVALRWCNSVGHALIRTVDWNIGGSRISRATGEWFDVLSELELESEKREGFNAMIGKYDSYDLYDNSFQDARTLYIPIQFSFTQQPGNAVPILALSYHQMELSFDFRDYTELIRCTTDVSSLVGINGRAPSCTIQPYITFVYLSSAEREVFLSRPSEYIIQDIQFNGDTPLLVDGNNPSLSRKINLDFAHPVSELVWTYNKANSYNSGITPSQYARLGNDYFNYTAPVTTIDPIASATIHINGSERFSRRFGSFFRLAQPYAHHKRIPTKRIYSYSFSLAPEEPTPSGSQNFSKADTAHLLITLDDTFSAGTSSGRLRIYARSWNILRIQQGLAGVVFASG
jgi:hypothetical protein